MITKPRRIVICAKDIMVITGKSERTARRIIAAIRRNNKLSAHAMVTITQFCRHTGLEENSIDGMIG